MMLKLMTELPMRTTLTLDDALYAEAQAQFVHVGVDGSQARDLEREQRVAVAGLDTWLLTVAHGWLLWVGQPSDVVAEITG